MNLLAASVGEEMTDNAGFVFVVELQRQQQGRQAGINWQVQLLY